MRSARLGPMRTSGAERRERTEERVEQLAFGRGVKARELGERVAVASAPEVLSRKLGIARDAGVRVVERGVAAFEARVLEAHAGRFEAEVEERRARAREREEARAHVVRKAGQRELFGAERAAGTPWVRFEHEHAVSEAREHVGSDEAVRAGADDDDVRICHGEPSILVKSRRRGVFARAALHSCSCWARRVHRSRGDDCDEKRSPGEER